MAYMTLFYIIFFSCVGHKEPRFMLPISPFLFLFAGSVLVDWFKQYEGLNISPNIRSLPPRILKVVIWGGILIDVTLFTVRQNYHDRFWDAMDYVTSQPDWPHSIYSMHRFETPYYSWLH